MGKRRFFQTLFTLSIALKGIDGVLELIGGLVFIILKKQHIINILSRFFHYDLFNIPNQTILKWVTYISNGLTTNIKIFISVVLICSGFIKILLSVSLLLRKLIAFPIALGFLVVLFIYQMAQMFYTPSLFLNFFNFFDAIVILVIWREYIHLKRTREMR